MWIIYLLSISGVDPQNESASGERTMKIYSGVATVLVVGLLLLSVAVVKLLLSIPDRWSVLNTLTFHAVWQVLNSKNILCEEFGICDLTLCTNQYNCH